MLKFKIKFKILLPDLQDESGGLKLHVHSYSKLLLDKGTHPSHGSFQQASSFN